jgi:hypothetical protein
MITKLLQVTDAVIGTALPVTTRHILASLKAGQPVVHTGGGNYTPIANDLTGYWSYQRIRGEVSVVSTRLAGDPCEALQATVPLRIVALLDRDTCIEEAIELAALLRSSTRTAQTGIGAFSVAFERLTWSFDQLAGQEFAPLPQIPTNRTLLVMDASIAVRAKASCMVDCEPVDVTCAIIAGATLDKIRECLGDRLEELCDVPPCDPTTVNGVESDTPTITVLQGGNPVGTLNPATGVVTIPECPEGCDEPFTLQFQVGETLVEVAAYPDPCGDTGVISCDTPVDAVVVEGAGTEEANGVYFVEERGVIMLWRKPDAGWIFYEVDDPPGFGTSPVIYDVDNVPLYSGLDVVSTQDPDGMDGMAWDAIDGQSPAPTVRQATLGDLCPCPPPEPCDPLTWELRDTNGDLLEDGSVEEPCGEELSIVAPDARVNWDGRGLISIPSGGLANLDCDTLVNAAYAVDGGSVTGTYKITGTANGRSIYTLDGSHRFEYSGTRWELIKPGSDYQAAVGSETFPWEADWSLTPVTVTQATIGAYCDDCEPANPVEVEVNGTLYASVPAAGSVDIPVINTATTPIGTVTPGVDVEIPDSAISVDSTPELNLPATVALNITLNDGTNPVTPVDVDTSTPGVMAIEVAPCTPTPPNLIELTTGGSYSKPSNLKELWMVGFGAGGGGSSARRNNSNSHGGLGGAGGAMVSVRIPAASLLTTETYVIGAGGAGGAATTGVSNAGTAGGDTSFGAHLLAKGGAGGALVGGSAVAGPAGGNALSCVPPGGPFALSGRSGNSSSGTLSVDGNDGFNGIGAAPSGGNAGGFLTGVPVAGGDGGGVYDAGILIPGGAGGALTGGNGANGANDQMLHYFQGFDIASTIGVGTGGGGGAASLTAGINGGSGGNSGRAAGGGGGGAVNTTPAQSGAGGDGGNGFLLLLEIFN